MRPLAEGWRNLHNEELRSLNSSPDIIRLIKSKRVRWAGYVACMEMINSCEILAGMLNRRDYLGSRGEDGNTILK
jgi:hypothetical protein